MKPALDETDWTSARRRTLAAVVGHLVPSAEAHGPEHGIHLATADYVARTLSTPQFVSQCPLVLAALDELDERAGESTTAQQKRTLADTTSVEREDLLRQLEADSNPYLAHAITLLVQLSLEGFLGDPAHGGNPQGQGWIDLGLGQEGLRRRLRPTLPPASGEENP